MELLAALNRHVMAVIDRRFFREAYNAQSIWTEMDEAIPTLSKTKQLVELAAEKISDALHPNNITIFLEDKDSGAYVAAYSSAAPTAGSASAVQLRSLVLPNDLGIINRLRKLKSLDLAELDHLRANIEAFIDQYYNRCRLHSALGYKSPQEFEQALESTTASTGATMSFFRHAEDYRPDDANASGDTDSKTRSGPQTAPPTIGFDESPAAYSLASCSPAELASASPADRDSEPEVIV